MKPKTQALLAGSLLLFTLHFATAGSATWDFNATYGNWNKAANWTPMTVPNSPADIATFAASNVTDLSITRPVTVDGIVFSPGASAYTITVGNDSDVPHFSFAGSGIMNNSGVVQNFVVPTGTALNFKAGFTFTGTAKAGTDTIFTCEGGASANTRLLFDHLSSADHATLIANGPSAGQILEGGFIEFTSRSTASNATLIANGGVHAGGNISFSGVASMGNATLIANGAVAGQNHGGVIGLGGGALGGHATFILNGSDVSPNGGGLLDCIFESSLGNATLIANPGRMAGGVIQLQPAADGANARVEVFGNGTLDVSGFSGNVVIGIGSLEGDGLVLIGSAMLTIGANSLDTTFSGQISGTGGMLTKVNAGTLALTGANTYSGGTVIQGGVLLVNNATGSATGSGAVQVVEGTLGGGGIVSGPVTVGTGAFLAPAQQGIPATLTTQSAVTFGAGSTYEATFRMTGSGTTADDVVAKGVTIDESAIFSFTGQAQGALTPGLTLTVISNTGATPINGTFSNLADGAVLLANGNHFQASYEGGDGNDLTLTVVP